MEPLISEVETSVKFGGETMGFWNKLKKQRKTYSNGVVIEYSTEPPHFRDASADEFGIVDACGQCKFCGDIRSKQPTCTKYGVKYNGAVGCLTKTVCDDFRNVLF